MKQDSAQRALPTMYQVLPPVARDLAIELETMLGNGGARTRLKIGAALAAAAALRDHDLWRALMLDAGAMGEADVARLSLDAAMRFAHGGATPPSDATTRILRLALLRGLRSDEPEGDDPIVNDCAAVVGIIYALSIARSVDQTSEDMERAASFLRLGRRPDSNRTGGAAPAETPPPRGVSDHRSSNPDLRNTAPPQSDPRVENAASFSSQRPSPNPRSDRERDRDRAGGRIQSSRPPSGEPGRQKEKSAGPRVLLVDDDESYRKLLQRMLSPLEVVHASTGLGALEVLATDGDFEVILSKVELPELSGAQMYETIKRKWPHLANVVIFVSSHGSAPEGQPILRKPINRDSLLRTIGRISKRIAEVHREK